MLAVHHVHVAGRSLVGGAEKYLLDTVAALLGVGAQVQINYSGNNLYESLAATAPANLTLTRTDWLGPNLGDDRRLSPALVARRWRWFRAARPDTVFVVQQGHGGAFGASVVAARLAGARVVVSVRQPALPPPPPGERRPFGIGLWRRRLFWRSRTIARSADLLVFNSQRVRDGYVEQWGWPVATSRVIRNGVLPAPPRSYRLGDGRVVFGCVGQVAPHKGCDVAIDAFRRLRAAPGKAELVFFGEGPDLDRLRHECVGEEIRFAGRLSDREYIYRGIDVLLAPARRESSSNAVLEAMARGIPCVVSGAGGLPELVEPGVSGEVVPVEDAAALAAVMSRMLADRSLIRTLGHAARVRAVRNHDHTERLRETLDAIWPGLGPAYVPHETRSISENSGDGADAQKKDDASGTISVPTPRSSLLN